MVEKEEVSRSEYPMQAAPRLYTEVFEVENRLKALGLNHGILLDSVRAGFLARSLCTELDPPMYPGQTMWAHTLRRLRQRTVLLGWKPNDDGNYSVALAPDGMSAIAVATGDANTGRTDATPLTASAKGPRTAEAIADNYQLSLDLVFHDELRNVLNIKSQPGKRETWLLLVHLDQSEVRAELSLPASLDGQDRVAGWLERIILPSIDFDPEQIELPDSDVTDIDIAVRRRV